jgi:uncharacterized membrane protein YphA (DoxX/SURF4 family)
MNLKTCLDWLQDRLTLSDNAQAWGLTVFRVLIGALFFYSGLSKLIQPIEYFEVAVAQYDLVPDKIIHAVCLVLPWIEFIGGTFLLLGRRIPQAAGVLAGLTGLFQLVLAQALLRRLPMDECGCFGGGFVHLTLFQSFTMDTALVLVLIQLATSEQFRLSLDSYLLKTSLASPRS